MKKEDKGIKKRLTAIQKKTFLRFIVAAMVVFVLFFYKAALNTTLDANKGTGSRFKPVIAKTTMDMETKAEMAKTVVTPVQWLIDTVKSINKPIICAKIVKNISTSSLEYAKIIEEAVKPTETPAQTEAPEPPEQRTSPKAQPEPEPQPEQQPEVQTEPETVQPIYAANGYQAFNYEEQKGFWITYLEYTSILKNQSQNSFRNTIGNYFDNIASLGFNTVYVQVRAYGDAYYNSELFPSGEQFNGQIGTSNRFDALQIMIDCAHARGLSVHAWINPMRLMTSAQLENIDDKYLIKQWYRTSGYQGTYIVESNGRWYLNPAYGEVTDLIAAGITEIVANYNVDGIQIDDYFYPTTDPGFDYNAYASFGTGMSLSSWRISNVNEMVKKLYQAVHTANGTVVFGISPQASVANNYNQLYADVRTWCREGGYCDYILPQVYFGFANSTTPYADTISQWSSMTAGSGVKLVIGLAPYKIGAVDTYAGSGQNEWLENSDMLKRQVEMAKTLQNYGGVAMYRYDSLFNPAPAVAEQVGSEIWNLLH